MKIITALENKKINEKLKEIKKYEIIGKDIIYQEAVLQILKQENNIDYLFLNIELLGELKKIEFIEQIIETNKKIKIILFVNKLDNDFLNFLKDMNQVQILKFKDMKIENILNIIENIKTNKPELLGNKGNYKNRVNHKSGLHKAKKPLKIVLQKGKKNKKQIANKTKTTFLKVAIKLQKNIYFKKSKNNKLKKENKNYKKNKIIKLNKNNKLKKYKIIKNKKIIIKNKKIKNNNIIISVSGSPGVGKSIFVINFINLIKNKKILILDFDYSINTILNIKNNNFEKYKIINYDNSIDILNLENTRINEELINKIFKNYEIILIDLNNNMELNKIFIKNNYLNILLIEPNLLGIKKANKILEKYNKYLKNNYEKINIIFNKYNIYSISNILLKIIFSKYKILGKINYDKNFDLIINKKNMHIQKQNQKAFRKIIRRCMLEKNNNYK